MSLKCGHVACEMCLDSWLKTNPICPTCRTSHEGPPIPIKTLDNTISHNIGTLLSSDDLEARKQREIEWQTWKDASRAAINLPQPASDSDSSSSSDDDDDNDGSSSSSSDEDDEKSDAAMAESDSSDSDSPSSPRGNDGGSGSSSSSSSLSEEDSSSSSDVVVAVEENDAAMAQRLQNEFDYEMRMNMREVPRHERAAARNPDSEQNSRRPDG
eukprot:247596_1